MRERIASAIIASFIVFAALPGTLLAPTGAGLNVFGARTKFGERTKNQEPISKYTIFLLRACRPPNRRPSRKKRSALTAAKVWA